MLNRVRKSSTLNGLDDYSMRCNFNEPLSMVVLQAALQLRLQRQWYASMPDKQLEAILSLFTRGIDHKPGFLLVL